MPSTKKKRSKGSAPPRPALQAMALCGGEATAREVMEIWESHGLSGFVRFKDGCVSNCRADNLAWVHLVDALRNPDWKVDWDMDLNAEQVEFVNANRTNFVALLT